jgi:hypothetical protein
MSVAILTCVLCITPWLVRNYLVFGHYVFVRSGFGLELYGGTRYQNRDTGWVYAIPKSEKEAYRQMGEVAYIAQRKRDAMSIILQHPGEFVRLSLERCAFFWAGNWMYFTSYEAHSHVGAVQMVLRFSLYFLFSLAALLGLGIAFRNGEEYALLFALPLVFYPLTYYATRVEGRYRHPIEPYLVTLGVYAVVSLSRRLKRGRNQG